MSVNLVTVTINIDGGPADDTGPEGNYLFSPAGVLWPDGSGEPIVPRIQQGQLASNATTKTASASAQIVASDSYTAGVLTWDVIINVRGMPTINVAGVAVNFANGATQSIWSILQAAGWAPIAQP